jgi:hypothetical protein
MTSDPASAFRDYIAAFNRGETVVYGAFYCDDVELVIGEHTRLRGRQAIFDFYARVREGTRRQIEVVAAVADDRTLAAELRSEFLATRDLPDFVSGPLRAGDRLQLETFVFYDLEDGRYRRIRSATHRRHVISADE